VVVALVLPVAILRAEVPALLAAVLLVAILRVEVEAAAIPLVAVQAPQEGQAARAGRRVNAEECRFWCSQERGTRAGRRAYGGPIEGIAQSKSA